MASRHDAAECQPFMLFAPHTVVSFLIHGNCNVWCFEFNTVNRELTFSVFKHGKLGRVTMFFGDGKPLIILCLVWEKTTIQCTLEFLDLGMCRGCEKLRN